MTMIRSERIKHIPSFSLTDQNNQSEKISKESPAGKGGTITQGYLQLVMLLGAIIARSSLSITDHHTSLGWMRSDKPIRLLIHPYPPPLCINTLPPPLMYFDRSLSVLTSRHFWLWPSTAYLQNFPRGGRLLASLNQVDLSLNNTYFLLNPPFFAPPW